MVAKKEHSDGYRGEDDIIRYEDIYARGQGAKVGYAERCVNSPQLRQWLLWVTH